MYSVTFQYCAVHLYCIVPLFCSVYLYCDVPLYCPVHLYCAQCAVHIKRILHPAVLYTRTELYICTVMNT